MLWWKDAAGESLTFTFLRLTRIASEPTRDELAELPQRDLQSHREEREAAVRVRCLSFRQRRGGKETGVRRQVDEWTRGWKDKGTR